MGMVTTGQRLECLRSVSIFHDLDPMELAALEPLLEPITLTRGETLCRRGDESDRLFILHDGEVEIRSGEPERAIRRLSAIDVIGEMGLVLGGPRTATVVATRPCELLAVDRDHFARLTTRQPHIMDQVCRVLARRLATSYDEDIATPSSDVVAVRSTRAHRRAGAIVVQALSVLLGDAPVISAAEPDAAQNIAKLRAEHRWIVLDAHADGAAEADDLATAFDVVIDVVEKPPASSGARWPARDTRHLLVIDALDQDRSPIAISHNEPFVLRGVGGDEVFDPAAPDGARRFLRARPRAPISRTLGRLARTLQGRVIGIALGGGAAFGIAHVGVLQVLEREGIPVDLVAGTSMGSIVGVGYAAGLDGDAMAQVARDTGGDWRKLLSLVDPNPFHPGVLSGDRLQRILRPFLGDVHDFDQLVLPCRTVTSDIRTGERIESCEGSLVDAARASSSIPILISPMSERDRVLVDGAIVDPVPAEVVRAMGADRVIAVNVVPKLEEGTMNALSRLSVVVGRANPMHLFNRSARVNVLDVAMNTIQSLQHELGQYKAISADVRLNPRLSDFTWLDFWHADEIVERGVEAAEGAIDELRALALP